VLHAGEALLKEMIANVESIEEECCGFLFGHETLEGRTLMKTMAAENVTQGDKHRCFEIAPKDYLYAENFAEQNNLHLLGIYHSHPNQPAVPSEHDRLAAQPYFSYIIISVFNNTLAATRSWRLNDNLQFVEEKINAHKLHKSLT